MIPDYEAIGQRIRAHRKLNNLTQSQLAEMIGRSTAFIGHIERGTRTMSIETLCKLSEALHITTDCILGYWG